MSTPTKHTPYIHEVNDARPKNLIKELTTLKGKCTTSDPDISEAATELIAVLEMGTLTENNFDGISSFTKALAALNVYAASINIRGSTEQSKYVADIRTSLSDMSQKIQFKKGQDNRYTLEFFEDPAGTKESAFCVFLRNFKAAVDELGPIVDPALQVKVLRVDLSGAVVTAKKDVGSYNVGPAALLAPAATVSE